MEYDNNQKLIELKDFGKHETDSNDDGEEEPGTRSPETPFKKDFRETLSRSRNGWFVLRFFYNEYECHLYTS